MMTKMAFSAWKALISLTAALFFVCSITAQAEEPASSDKASEPGLAARSSQDKPDKAATGADADVGLADAVVIDDGAALQNQIELVRHRLTPRPGLHTRPRLNTSWGPCKRMRSP